MVNLFGWWSSSSSSPSPPKPSSDGGYIAPGRQDRAACWEARDVFNDCLDRHAIIDSIKEKDAAAQKCGPENRAFEQNCAASWVKYFKQKRVADFKKAEILRRQEQEEGLRRA